MANPRARPILMSRAERAEIERLRRRVAEPHPGTGVKCAHCNGSGRITTVEQYLKTLPANWHEDSGLATWFPLVAEEIERLQRELAENAPYMSISSRR